MAAISLFWYTNMAAVTSDENDLYIEIIRLISLPGKVGSYKQPLIQQIVHAAFDPLGVRQHYPCDSNF
jgi:hypothetical protein